MPIALFRPACGLARACALPLIFALALAGPAAAQIAFLPEVRGGIGAHDVGPQHIERPQDILLNPARIRTVNAELLFSIPDLNAWTILGELRPHIGATVNLDGAESLAYAGLSWTVRAPLVPVMAEIGLGGAIHNDSLRQGPPRFGCPALVHAQASLGVEVLPRTTLMATVQHATDMGMCGTPDTGLTTAGLRLGIRF